MSSRVRVYVDEIDSGAGFFIDKGIVLTAAHVVPEDRTISVVVDGQSPPLHARSVKKNNHLDVAAIIVDSQGTEPSMTCVSQSGDRWRIASPPDEALPHLTGWISEAQRAWKTASGEAIKVDQLTVVEGLGDYHGYSGAPVLLSDQDNAVAAILIEQQHMRGGTTHGLQVAANVLFAVPIDEVLAAFEIKTRKQPRVSEGLPAGLFHHDRVLESLRGDKSRLGQDSLAFVAPEASTAWSPQAMWTDLSDPSQNGLVLLTGHGGVGKTRTLIEVGNIAVTHGWDVLHLRGTKAMAVSQYLTDRLADDARPPLLLVIDYLNRAEELDPLAVSELTYQYREPMPRLSILASARTGWARRNALDAGMDRFTRIALAPTSDEVRATCQAIVESVAPQASIEYGSNVLLQITGSTRPVLAVLIGEVIEAQYLDRHTLPDALVSEDLARWLESRLLEDGFFSDPFADDYEVAPALMNAAAVLAMSPGKRRDLEEGVASVIGGAQAVEIAGYTLDKLLRLGWLAPDDRDEIAPAHDVVVDKVVGNALFHGDSDVVRTKTAATLLSSYSSSARAFNHVLSALERLLDERDSAIDTASNLIDASTGWLDKHSHALARIGEGQDPDASSTASKLLTTTLWRAETETRWRKVVAPILCSRRTDVNGGEALLIAARALPPNAEPPVVQLALAWIDANTAEQQANYLLQALIGSEHSAGTHAEAVLDAALAWLDANPTNHLTNYLLQALIRSERLTGNYVEPVWRAVRIWLDANPASPLTNYLLQALLRSGHLTRYRARKVSEASIEWLNVHSRAVDAGHLLQELVRSDQTPGGILGEIWDAALVWLHANPAERSTHYLLQALARSNKFNTGAGWDAALAWLDIDSTKILTDDLLRKMIRWEREASGKDSRTGWDAARTWVDTTPTLKQTDYLRRAIIRWESATESHAEEVWAAAVAWLDTFPQAPGASQLLVELLEQSESSVQRATEVLTVADRWLSVAPNEEPNRLALSAAVKLGNDSRYRERVVALALDWLERFPAAPGTGKIVKNLLEWSKGKDAAHHDRAVRVAQEWLRAAPTSQQAGHLLRLLAKGDDKAKDVGHIFDTAAMWLNRRQSHPSAPEVLVALLSWDESGRSSTAVDLAFTWLQSNSARRVSAFVIRALTTKRDLKPGQVFSLLDIAEVWLTENYQIPLSSIVLAALDAWAQDDENVARRSAEIVAQWRKRAWKSAD